MTTADKLKWCLDRLDECKWNKAALDAAKEAISDLIERSKCDEYKTCNECPLRYKRCTNIGEEVAKKNPGRSNRGDKEMTTEEVIQHIDNLYHSICDEYCASAPNCGGSCEHTEAMEIAKKALEKAERYKWHDVSENPPKPGKYIVKVDVVDGSLSYWLHIWMYYGNGKWEFYPYLDVVKWKEIDWE